MYRTHIISSLASILFGILLIAWIIPTQTPEWPGYGMPASLLPNILAWIIIVSASINLIKTIITGYGKGQPSPLSFKMFLHLLAFTAVLAAAMPLMSMFGYFIGSAIVLAACCLLCGERKPVRLVIVAAATIVVIWAALWKGLGVMLPGM
ncbi:tripartite tricarboxylate transporter TctB family protein [Mailhella sp.]|uniref:tripartite tricarboxylate transporter TctB family protein n=1 Tax=Mailhella sp. TaxID=1981029 RepID=UPI003AB859A3